MCMTVSLLLIISAACLLYIRLNKRVEDLEYWKNNMPITTPRAYKEIRRFNRTLLRNPAWIQDLNR